MRKCSSRIWVQHCTHKNLVPEAGLLIVRPTGTKQSRLIAAQNE